MNLKRLGWALAGPGLLASALLLASCSSGEDSKGDDNGGKPAATKASEGGKAQSVTVSLKDNAFDPKEITVEKGAVTFEVKNTGAAIHNLHVISTGAEGKDFFSKTTIEPGASDKFTATFTKSGTLKFQCDFHLPDMVGTITVK